MIKNIQILFIENKGTSLNIKITQILKAFISQPCGPG
jgi:hypothetical protein